MTYLYYYYYYFFSLFMTSILLLFLFGIDLFTLVKAARTTRNRNQEKK